MRAEGISVLKLLETFRRSSVHLAVVTNGRTGAAKTYGARPGLSRPIAPAVP